jgi:glutathione S-transferase
MSLKLYFHPLSSFCQKALIALYESGTPFEPVLVDLGDAASRAAFAALWPMAKMPVLRDETRDRTVAEATIIIEYLDTYYPGPTRFIPTDVDRAWQARMWDRFYDHYVNEPMQKIVTDRLRPEGANDAFGVEQAKAQIREAYAVIEQAVASKSWTMGDGFTLADCSAAPALFYANTVLPIEETQTNLRGYAERLMARPSYARALAEAEPYFAMFPMERKPQIAKAGTMAAR